MRKNNIFLYFVGREYKLVSILQNLIYLHSTNGIGYNVICLTDKNLKDYIKDIPDYFYNLCPSHKAYFIRVNVICEHGGIWLDSNVLILNSLDSLFDLIETKNGFFIKENNSVFGSKPHTELMIKWRSEITNILDSNQENNSCSGCIILQNIIYDKIPDLFNDYNIFDGMSDLYPVNTDNCISEFIDKTYDNYKTIIREYQPIIVLSNSIHRKLENLTEKEIFDGYMPLNYFINKSFENLKLTDYDFIEIGTSDYETLIEIADDTTKGISVDAVKCYIDKLPNKKNVKKLNLGISNENTLLDVYYIPEKTIKENNLPYWVKGCNSINDYHPLHVDVHKYCEIEKVKVITTYELFYQNSVRNVRFLKIDTEGHDCIILKTLFFYIKYLPTIFYPKIIQFETNRWTKTKDVDEIILLFSSIGYKLESRGEEDSVLTYT
jgi:hypothetical protein